MCIERARERESNFGNAATQISVQCKVQERTQHLPFIKSNLDPGKVIKKYSFLTALSDSKLNKG